MTDGPLNAVNISMQYAGGRRRAVNGKTTPVGRSRSADSRLPRRAGTALTKLMTLPL